MHSRIIRRPNLGHNLKGKFKFSCIICTHTIYDAMERSQVSYDFISRSLITQPHRGGGRRD